MRDKASAENAVRLVEMWVLAPLRHRQFFSLTEANAAIAEKLGYCPRVDPILPRRFPAAQTLDLNRVTNPTIKYDKVIFILEPSDQAKAAIGKRVTVVDHPDGRLSIRYKGVGLAYRTFDKLRQVPQAAIVENKRLGAALAVVREQQIERAETRSRSAPRRRDQRDARLFKVG